MKMQIASAPNSRIALRAKSLHNRHKEETLTTNWVKLGYLLDTYARDDVIAEADAEITISIESLNKTLIDYTELL